MWPWSRQNYWTKDKRGSVFESECSFEIATTIERLFRGPKLQKETVGGGEDQRFNVLHGAQ